MGRLWRARSGAIRVEVREVRECAAVRQCAWGSPQRRLGAPMRARRSRQWALPDHRLASGGDGAFDTLGVARDGVEGGARPRPGVRPNATDPCFLARPPPPHHRSRLLPRVEARPARARPEPAQRRWSVLIEENGRGESVAAPTVMADDAAEAIARASDDITHGRVDLELLDWLRACPRARCRARPQAGATDARSGLPARKARSASGRRDGTWVLKSGHVANYKNRGWSGQSAL